MLRLPDEVLILITARSGPSCIPALALTCTRLLGITQLDATWRAILRFAEFGGADTLPAGECRVTALEHYCKSCDSIVCDMAMLYPGAVCLACEYSNPHSAIVDAMFPPAACEQ